MFSNTKVSYIVAETADNSLRVCLEKMADDQDTSIEKLEEINCQGMNITSLSNINQAPNLKRIDVSNNQISHLSDDLFKLKNIEELYLMNNQIPFIPNEVQQLQQIQILDISGNRLTSIPTVINQLTKLKTLDVSTNRLVSFPPIDKLNLLTKLYINDNQLIELPSFETIPLQELFANNNLLRSKTIKTLNQDFSVEKRNSFSLVDGTHLIINETWDGDLQNIEEYIRVDNGETFQGTFHVSISNIYTASGSLDNLTFYFDDTTQEVIKSATVYASLVLETTAGSTVVSGDLPISFNAPPPIPGTGGTDSSNENEVTYENIIIIPETTPAVIAGVPVNDLEPGLTIIQETESPTTPNTNLSRFFINHFSVTEDGEEWWEVLFESDFLLKTGLVIVLLIPVTFALLLYTKIRTNLVKIEKDFF